MVYLAERLVELSPSLPPSMCKVCSEGECLLWYWLNVVCVFPVCCLRHLTTTQEMGKEKFLVTLTVAYVCSLWFHFSNTVEPLYKGHSE